MGATAMMRRKRGWTGERVVFAASVSLLEVDHFGRRETDTIRVSLPPKIAWIVPVHWITPFPPGNSPPSSKEGLTNPG
jgi:hypothetical protein